jgi:holo-[acyl-carrier protein] synthase
LIFGIGTDLVAIDRIADSYRRFGRRLVERILMPCEVVVFDALPDREPRQIRFLAQRFASKEAIVKALGTGFAHGMWVRDCGVLANTWGRPEVVWSARGARRAAELGAGAGHITITDEQGLIVAVAVLEKAVGLVS